MYAFLRPIPYPSPDSVAPRYYPNQRDADYFNASYAGGAEIHGNVSDDAHLMVWSRPSATTRVQKPWARIDRTLKKGEVLELRVVNNFNVYGYGGHKTVLLSEDSWIGAKNFVLPITLLSLAGLSLLMAIVFVLIHVSGKRKFGDLSQASWSKAKPT